MTSAMDKAENVLLTHVNKLWAWTVGYTLLLVSSGKFKVGDTLAEALGHFIKLLHVPTMCPWGLRSFRKAKFSQNIIRIQEKNVKTHLPWVIHSSSFQAGHEAWVVFPLKHEIQDSNGSLKVLQGNVMLDKSESHYQ